MVKISASFLFLSVTSIVFFIYIFPTALLFYNVEFWNIDVKNDNVPWRCTRMISSGLGDRLLSYFAIAALAHHFNKTIFLKWDISGDYDLRIYPLPEILDLFQFPANMIFIPSNQFDKATKSFKEIEFDNSDLPSYECMYELLNSFALKMLRIPGRPDTAKNYVNLQSYLTSYRSIGSQFGYKPHISSTNGSYIIFHYRNGDKRNQAKNKILPNRYGNDSRSPKLYCTHEILAALEKKNAKVIMVSDDPELAIDLLKQYPFLIPSHYFYPQNHTNTKLANESTDLALALNAIAIIQHSPLGWSSFSAAASLLRHIPLFNTWTENRHDCMKDDGYIPALFYQMAMTFPVFNRCPHRWPYDWTCVNKIVDYTRLGGNPIEFHMCRRPFINEDIAAFLELVNLK